jgi:TPR repeat protein
VATCGCMKIKTFLMALGIAFSIFIQPLAAGQLEDGIAIWGQNNFEEALKLLRPLAEQGNAEAQLHLGFSYSGGLGVQKDYDQAVKWYRRAADQGEHASQYFLGAHYKDGIALPQDFTLAYMWYSLAASGPKTDSSRISIAVRDEMAKLMTSKQIAKAKKLIREWKASPRQP